MKIPAKIHYALLIMTDIAMQGENATVTANDIARRQNISFAFVAQLLNKLKHTGMLESIRGGVSGGFHFKTLPSEITVKKIIDAVESAYCICPSKDIKTNLPVDDMIRSFWQELEGELEARLEMTTIENLAKRVKAQMS